MEATLQESNWTDWVVDLLVKNSYQKLLRIVIEYIIHKPIFVLKSVR